MIPPLQMFDHEAVCDTIRREDDWYEGDILRDVLALYPSQRGIVDVGAHIGNHSVFWLQYSPPSLLYAFEPMPETFALLRANLAPYEQAFAVPVALSASCGYAMMLRDNVNRGRSHFSSKGDVRVPVTTLDDWGLDDVSLLKVDVEGYQAWVLRGAAETLRRCLPALLLEDGEGVVPHVLRELGLTYRLVRSWKGSNYLYAPG